MASPGLRGEAAAQECDARAAAIDHRLAARERSLTDRIRELEACVGSLEGGETGGAMDLAAQAARRVALQATLEGLRRERYCLVRARAAVATLPGPGATTLASLREGFAPTRERQGRPDADARRGP